MKPALIALASLAGCALIGTALGLELLTPMPYLCCSIILVHRWRHRHG